MRSHAAHAARTSSTASLDGADVSDDTIVQRIRARVARFAGVGEDFLEPLQVVRYNQGQHYAKHHDFFPICDIADKYRNGRRTRTFLIYLNDLPDGEIGGGTQFPELEVELRPEKGAALVWNNCLDNGHEDGRTLHAGLPLHEPGSVKYAINGKSYSIAAHCSPRSPAHAHSCAILSRRGSGTRVSPTRVHLRVRRRSSVVNMAPKHLVFLGTHLTMRH